MIGRQNTASCLVGPAPGISFDSAFDIKCRTIWKRPNLDAVATHVVDGHIDTDHGEK